MLNFYRFRQDYLKFEGSDRLDLINRLSTNQVSTLQKFHGIKTVLTSDKGRIVDVLTLYNFGDFIFTTCSFNNAKNVLMHLEKYTIMDDFKPYDLAGTHESILFFGERADDFVKDVFKVAPGKLINNDFEIPVIDERHSIVARNDDNFGGYLFIFSSNDNEFWRSRIFADELRMEYSLNEIEEKQYKLKRIEYGIPVYPNEMNDRTNPLECEMNRYVSFSKGCYIGQEVIARLDTYDKISKHLVKIETRQELTDENSKILTDGKECGFITSAADEKGLGFVKTVSLDFNKDYAINQNGITLSCKLKPINN